MSQAEQIAQFCSALLGGPDGTGDDQLDDLRCYVWTIGTESEPRKRTRWSRADPASVASVVQEAADRQPKDIAHVYISTSLSTARQAEEKGSGRRAHNDDIAGLLGVCVDIDIAGPGHAALAYPPDEATAHQVYGTIPLSPTLVVHSGHGLQVWWLLNEPWLVERDTDRQEMYDFSLAWSATLRYRAHQLGGWKVDSTFDLARVMRVPGTWNCKPDIDPVPARLVRWNPDQRYELDDLRAHLADEETLRGFRSGHSGGMVAELPGVDLNAAWARATSAGYRLANYTPPWLADMLEFMPGSTLEAVWWGDKTLNGDASPSGVDASLARLLVNTSRVSIEQIAEAIMCRRLRTDEKTEKVDPSRRVDYLATTLTRVIEFAASDGAAPAIATRDDHWQRAANGRVATPPAAEPDSTPPSEPVREPAAGPAPSAGPDENPKPEEAGPDEFSDYVTGLIDTDSRPVSPPPGAPPDESPIRLLPPPPRSDPGAWSRRHDAVADALKDLAALLLPGPFREVGIEIWSLEYRDFGEAQRGRMVLRIPPEYDWPASNRPPTHRPGRPFYCAWYKRDLFEVPKGFRLSLTRDALIPALPVGANREAWAALIDMLVPYWQRDSSGSDLVAQVHEWLLEFLISHAATTQQAIAVDNQRALLLDHAEWGTTGAPSMYLPSRPFLDFVARQPGGLSGRNGRVVLDYLDLTPRRPRFAGSDGQECRPTGWFEIAGGEFTAVEWREILVAARDAQEAGEARKLRMVQGGGS